MLVRPESNSRPPEWQLGAQPTEHRCAVVRVIEGKIAVNVYGNPGEIDFGSGSSYRESAVFNKFISATNDNFPRFLIQWDAKGSHGNNSGPFLFLSFFFLHRGHKCAYAAEIEFTHKLGIRGNNHISVQ